MDEIPFNYPWGRTLYWIVPFRSNRPAPVTRPSHCIHNAPQQVWADRRSANATRAPNGGSCGNAFPMIEQDTLNAVDINRKRKSQGATLETEQLTKPCIRQTCDGGNRICHPRYTTDMLDTRAQIERRNRTRRIRKPVPKLIANR